MQYTKEYNKKRFKSAKIKIKKQESFYSRAYQKRNNKIKHLLQARNYEDLELYY